MARRSRAARAAARREAAEAHHPQATDGRQALATPELHPQSPPRAVQVLQDWSPTVARVVLGVVLLWFGLHELLQPSLWTGYVPAISSTSQLALGMVLFHGWLLAIAGVALVLGIATRLVAAFSALLLIEIVLSLTLTGGLSDIVLRDLGVFGLAVAVFAGGRQRLVLRG